MFFELFKNSSVLCFSIVLLITWIFFIIDILGESGVCFSLGTLHIIIFATFPLYLVEYFLTGCAFKGSVSGTIFLISSCLYTLTIISAFLLGRYVVRSDSFFDKLLSKYQKSLDKR